MCIPCQGSIAHPPLQEIPVYLTLLQAGSLVLVGYWFAAKKKIMHFFHTRCKRRKKPEKE